MEQDNTSTGSIWLVGECSYDVFPSAAYVEGLTRPVLAEISQLQSNSTIVFYHAMPWHGLTIIFETQSRTIAVTRNCQGAFTRESPSNKHLEILKKILIYYCRVVERITRFAGPWKIHVDTITKTSKVLDSYADI